MAAIELVSMSELTCNLLPKGSHNSVLRGKHKCCMAHYRRPSTTSSGPHVRELETQELYREAFDVACHAVQLDNSGMHAEAREAYIDAIQLLDRLLIQKSDSSYEGERQLIIQKSQEYSSRAEQLYRYSFTAVISSHPDASQHAITHDRKSHKGKLAGPLDSRYQDNDQAWVPKSDIDILLEKAYFTLDQAILNEEKDFTDHSLELYKDAASNFLKVYRKLSKDDPRCHHCHELCMQALNKVDELKKSDTTNGLLVPQKEFSPKDDHHASSSISSASSSYYARSITNHGAAPLGALKCKEDENSMKKLSSAEIEILKLTSNVNSKLFLPWVDESDLREKFTYDELFIDPDGSLPLSALQRAKFGGWKRPSEIMRNPKMIELVSSSALVQDVVTDCSFVASLCVSAAYERKFRKQLITSCIYPQNKFGQPCYNPSGKYMIKLHYNGIKRKIIVDDLLPVSRDGTLMCTFSTNHEELWAPIIEKAYMKLMGGYDFPGSNSGIDLYTLTGWIPEHIFVEDKDFVANNVWDRLMGGQKYGDVLVTISTGEMSEESAAERGLVPTHAYAVIDIREVNGTRFMQVKNPWSHLRWKGPYSHMDTERWNPELMKALNYDPSSAMQFDDGIFWIDFDSVCENFVSIHLNWNPELFMYRWALHIPWHCDVGPKKDTYNLGYNPQFKLVVKVPENKTSAVWLLMSKHITVTEPKNTDFITLHVYNDTNGERVYHHGKAFKEGTYVNSPHILIRFNAPPGTSTYTIVFSQHEKLKTLYFSLKAFSFSQFELTDVPQTYSIEQKISGRWTDQSSGGNASNASFMNNPQWKLTISPPESTGQQKCGIIIMLEAPKTFAIHLLLVEGGKRVASFSPREVVSQTNSYQHGFCCCELRDIKPGSYTIIASTYEPGLVGDFLLTIASNTQYTIDSIPVEGAKSHQWRVDRRI
ncbi:hypothetical protein K450DRAFT_252026 [Umbelopsis ramanniana AG]|uniref:Calpain catalytic domain-containing protein n=1 Tax=Umbelopsis ramanniana AG TaxID=1314678 RepID=A0AAD5E747_UMBRA|nr:uncharacterized protein K450DRAFT_252026 [Umbelopsis ramanniana AG]KAI8577511.1 hypothetical protein K450DRAFT_252026 [Umbelopsis ramanniana AG]